MNTAVEISLYPLTDNYLEVIRWFIERVDGVPSIKRVTNGMSTQLQGPHGELMDLLRDAMAEAHQCFGKAVLVAKFIPGGVNLEHSQ